MPTIPYVNNGSFQAIKVVYVNNGSWVPARYVYANVAGVWTRVYPIDAATSTNTSSGSYEVPNTIPTLRITAACGGGGGGGS
jgi:hypothetical protein